MMKVENKIMPKQENEVEFHTFNAKQSNIFYMIVIVVGILIISFLTFFGYTYLFKSQKSQPAQVIKTVQNSPTLSPTPTKYEIGITYEGLKIGETDITFQGTEGELVIPKSGPGVLFFKGTPENHTDAVLSDLQIGQKVKLEIIPGEKVWVYIL